MPANTSSEQGCHFLYALCVSYPLSIVKSSDTTGRSGSASGNTIETAKCHLKCWYLRSVFIPHRFKSLTPASTFYLFLCLSLKGQLGSGWWPVSGSNDPRGSWICIGYLHHRSGPGISSRVRGTQGITSICLSPTVSHTLSLLRSHRGTNTHSFSLRYLAHYSSFLRLLTQFWCQIHALYIKVYILSIFLEVVCHLITFAKLAWFFFHFYHFIHQPL